MTVELCVYCQNILSKLNCQNNICKSQSNKSKYYSNKYTAEFISDDVGINRQLLIENRLDQREKKYSKSSEIFLRMHRNIF